MKKILFLLLVLSVAACKKSNQQNAGNNPVQSIPVSLTIYPNDPTNFKIQAIGGWMYFSGGLNGIVVYRKTEQDFIAVERTSSYAPSNAKAKVWVMSDNFSLIDSVSQSRWRIFDGSVTKGPATWPLRLYGAVYDGNALVIRN